jgi:O-antigen ligase
LFETLVLWHIGTLVVVVSWCFGGQVWWARDLLAVWGGAGMLLFAVAATKLRRWGPALRLLWPLLLYNALVIASCFNPGFEQRLVDGAPVYVVRDAIVWLPSSARPSLSARELWQLDGIVVSCASLMLFITRRRHLRGLLTLFVVNAVVLAVFGTLQKLSGAKALLFGLVPVKQTYFFATFVYHNHWGAFTLLNLAACLGLLFHHERRGGWRDAWHSPLFAGGLVALLLAATAPLSGSRSTTVLQGALLFAALLHFTARVIARRRELRESVALPVAGISVLAAAALGAVVWLAGDVIRQRADHTARQITQIQRAQTLNSRLTVYRDTWRMAMDKPWFGWGLESYADVFRIYNSQRSVERWTPFYAEAHNDWFQSLAESGFVGTGLLLLLGLLPVLAAPWARARAALPRYLAGAAALLLLYAIVEFPLANPSVLIGHCASVYLACRYTQLEAARHATPAAR